MSEERVSIYSYLVQYRPLTTDGTGREYLAGITNIRCKRERQKGGPQVG